jgi:sec-independent protein translocase protein TatA
MGSFSIWHWIVVVVLFLLLFGGRGKISELMGDFAQGIKSFKKGMQDDESDGSKPDDSKQAQVNTDHRLSEPLAQPAHRSDSPV